MRPRGSGVAPGRVHGVRGLVQDVEGFLATGGLLSKFKGASIEAPAGALEGGARFLVVTAFPRALSSLGMGPPLNRGHFKNLSAAASSYMTLTLDATETLRMRGRMLLGLVKGRATAAARTATSSPAAATHTMASAAVNMCSLPSETAFRAGSSRAVITLAWVSFGMAAHAFLRILEPEGEKRR